MNYENFNFIVGMVNDTLHSSRINLKVAYKKYSRNGKMKIRTKIDPIDKTRVTSPHTRLCKSCVPEMGKDFIIQHCKCTVILVL